jgi:hypothetical protein
VDPFSLLLAAQAAVAAIRSGCEMLREGKAEIDKFKKTVEQGVGDAKAIYKEVTGIWTWLKGLFGGKPPAPAISVIKPAAEPVKAEPAKKAKRQPEPELSYEEYKARAIHDVCEQLKTFFEIQRQLKEHCRELEEQSKTTERVADSAIDRIEIETQLVSLSTQIREAMTYTPEELGLQDLYKRFLAMYALILEEQEFERQLKRKKERDAKWQRELLRNHRIDRAVVAALVSLGILWMWAFLLSLGWLARTHAGL